MGELIRIGAPEGAPEKAGLGATIDRTGAWVTELSIGKDHILFPRDLVPTGDDELKFRGGMHPCSPYFGADPDGDGPQHGFARDAEWEVAHRNDMYVRLEHLERAGRYAGLFHGLGVQIVKLGDSQMFVANLSITNYSGSTLKIAPGFHPYFAGPGSSGVFTEDPTFENPQDLASYSSERIGLSSVDLSLGMFGRNLPSLVRWTDSQEQYHCVEPVATSGFNRNGLPNLQELQPGASFHAGLSIKVSQNKAD